MADDCGDSNKAKILFASAGLPSYVTAHAQGNHVFIETVCTLSCTDKIKKSPLSTVVAVVFQTC